MLRWCEKGRDNRGLGILTDEELAGAFGEIKGNFYILSIFSIFDYCILKRNANWSGVMEKKSDYIQNYLKNFKKLTSYCLIFKKLLKSGVRFVILQVINSDLFTKLSNYGNFVTFLHSFEIIKSLIVDHFKK